MWATASKFKVLFEVQWQTMSRSRYILHDPDSNGWEMFQNYEEWTHRDINDWFQEVNELLYGEYERTIKESGITGRDFEKMQNG